MSWTCFLLEPTDRVMRALRRYVANSPGLDCASGYHTAMARIEDGPLVTTERHTYRTDPEQWPHDDPRWPARCACGYVFTPGDVWQLFYERLYRDPRDGREYALRDAPAGAIWDEPWNADHWHGADGRCLGLMLPDGSSWIIDGPASNAPGKLPGWDRSGQPPRLTARPSILTPRYHGWLTDGVLSDDLEGRVY